MRIRKTRKMHHGPRLVTHIFVVAQTGAFLWLIHVPSGSWQDKSCIQGSFPGIFGLFTANPGAILDKLMQKGQRHHFIELCLKKMNHWQVSCQHLVLLQLHKSQAILPDFCLVVVDLQSMGRTIKISNVQFGKQENAEKKLHWSPLMTLHLHMCVHILLGLWPASIDMAASSLDSNLATVPIIGS
jgi:hypothetical protein